MIKITGKISNNAYLACSGGVDSMAVLDFLRSGKKNVTVLYFNHGTEHSNWVQSGLQEYCNNNSIKMIVGHPYREKDKEESLEEYWRDIRYNFLHSFNEDVITAHHLDDVVETYLFSMMHGKQKLINYRKHNVIRPFLTTDKESFERWCENKNVPFWEDKSNKDVKFARNRIRHIIVPEVMKINPGIKKTVKKLIEQKAQLEKA